MQQPTIGDKFQFEENTTEYVITDVVKYHEDGEFSNKLYQDGYQIKYINQNTYPYLEGAKFNKDLSMSFCENPGALTDEDKAMGETLAHIVHLERRGLINNIPRDGRIYEGNLITTDAWFPAALG